GAQTGSVCSQTWYLRDNPINHPVVHVFVAGTGDTNLPKPKSSGQSQTSIFDLGIRHVMLGRGEVYYNDRKSALDADLHNLQFESRFDPAGKRYSGGLGYSDGK